MVSSSATATMVGRRRNPASRSASWSLASRTTSCAEGGSGGRGGRRSTNVPSSRSSRKVKFDPPPSPIRRARTSPEPSRCSSRNARTRSSTSRGALDVPTAATVSTMSPDNPGPTGTVRSYGAMRRRLYLMRHGAVSYFRADGTPVREDEVALNEDGRLQAAAAQELLAGIEFDRVLTSSLPRTIETARIVAPGADPEEWPDLRELRGASLAEI